MPRVDPVVLRRLASLDNVIGSGAIPIEVGLNAFILREETTLTRRAQPIQCGSWEENATCTKFTGLYLHFARDTIHKNCFAREVLVVELRESGFGSRPASQSLRGDDDQTAEIRRPPSSFAEPPPHWQRHNLDDARVC